MVNPKNVLRLALLLALVGALGCATPVGVSRAGELSIYRRLTANVLSTGRPSPHATQFLARLGLAEEFKNEPRATLRKLHAGLGGLDEHDRLFALAELSYHHAREARNPQYFLAAAFYAYAFLFPEDRTTLPDPYDPRLRLAMDLYNHAITDGLRDPESGRIDLAPRRLDLPFGTLELVQGSVAASYDAYQLGNFTALEDYVIRGLRNRYRRHGIGAALAARAKPRGAPGASRWFQPRSKIPVSVLVRFDAPRRALRDGRLTGGIELHDADATPAVRIVGHSVPLESDPSAALALSLEYSPLWDFEIAGFRRGDFKLFGKKSQGDLLFFQPYRPGRIPVVFAHGTASSPARWAEMLNELLGDPRIAARYQFWFYIYNSGNPIALSAMHLRELLAAAVRDLDPAGQEPALRDMVVIGHSQGGLLAKMAAVRSGSRFWENVSREPFERAELSPETRDLLRRSLFVEPLPFVRRIIFIATPHRGSYLAENFLGRIARQFVQLPATLGKTAAELILLDPAGATRTLLRLPTSIENMNWSHPFLRTLYALPVAPGVKAHSIIAVKGEGPVEAGTDGVVRYTSARIEGVESELVVRSEHSTQSNPHTIEEVRRILYTHAGMKQ